MRTTTASKLRKVAAAALMSGVGAVAALGLATGTAQAGEGPIDAWSNYEWCPGEELPQADGPITWDMNICHFWHYQDARENPPSLYHVVEGLRPNPCPPIAFMCP
jgi:hypothetical protein